MKVSNQSCNSCSRLHNELSEVYLHIKVRNNSEMDNYDTEKHTQEVRNLSKIENSVLLGYIKSCFEILLSQHAPADAAFIADNCSKTMS